MDWMLQNLETLSLPCPEGDQASLLVLGPLPNPPPGGGVSI